MRFARSIVGLVALTLSFFYLSTAGSNSGSGAENLNWILIAGILICALIWIVMGSPKASPVPQRISENPTSQAEEQGAEEDEESQLDLPELVTEETLDGASLRERKLAKIQAAEEKKMAVMNANILEEYPQDEELVEVTVELEDVHVADEFVVEVSPESVENADIEMTVSQRRVRHDEIRKRIELRRRGQMAEIRASTARMWEDQTAGEDLVAVLQTPGHGHTVLETPLNPPPGHIYGATFIRIDEARILKFRTSLDEGFEQVNKPEKVEPEPLVGLDGLPLPVLLDTAGNPLPMPLPMPSASGALAALKDEMQD
jgi:hypothetical protein